MPKAAQNRAWLNNQTTGRNKKLVSGSKSVCLINKASIVPHSIHRACGRSKDLECSPCESLQRRHVSLIISRLVNRGFGDEGGVGEAQVIQQPPEWFPADASLPDVLMPVEL